MHGDWLHDLESFEAISQDDETRTLCLRMAELSRHGRLAPFLFELASDGELDSRTKATLAELACDESFLLALEDYLLRTRALH